MLITEFKQLVLDYMNRDGTVFDLDSVSTTDKVLNAANLAKLYAQRKLTFELAKTSVQLSVTSSGSSLLSSATPIGGGTAVKTRKILDAFLKDGSYYRPIRVVSKAAIADKARDFEPLASARQSNTPDYCGTYFYRFGDNVGLEPFPGTSPVDVYLDIVRWMPAYSSTVTTDFFLEECQDWMLFRTIQILSASLKEDRRVQINSAIVEDAWRSIVSWNESIVFGKAELDI